MTNRSTRTVLTWLIVVGFAIRAVIAILNYGYGGDVDAFGDWAKRLNDQPLSQFYAVDDFQPDQAGGDSDHLPGDLWIHAGLARTFAALGGTDYHSSLYRGCLKLVPTIADLAIGVLAFGTIRRLSGDRAGIIAAAAIILNPAVIVISALWGQWDSVSMFVLLAGVAVAIRWPDRWLLAIPLFGWAVIMKPPLAALATIALLPLAADALRDVRAGTRSVWSVVRGALAALLIGVGSMQLLLAPFRVGLPGVPMRWSLLDRVDIALELYPNATMGALNLQSILSHSLVWTPDDLDWKFGLSYREVGTYSVIVALILTALMAVIAWRRARAFDATAWLMSAVAFAWFLFPTRVHERYLFPAVVMFCLLAALRGRDVVSWGVAIAATLAMTANCLHVYYTSYPPGPQDPPLWIAWCMCAIWLTALLIPLTWRHRERLAEVRTAPESHPAA